MCPRIALKAALNLCLAFEKIHSKGLIHNDIKENNIMVTPTGEVTVLDLGAMTPTGQTVFSEPVCLSDAVAKCAKRQWYCPTIYFGGTCSTKTAWVDS